MTETKNITNIPTNEPNRKMILKTKSLETIGTKCDNFELLTQLFFIAMIPHQWPP